MSYITHLILFLLSLSFIWVFAGLVVDSVDRVAKRFNQSGFTVAFFVLGLLTSISEVSVMVNSAITGTPGVSAGNLVGASFVILMLIIPFLAVAGNGVQLRKTLSKSKLAFALLTVALPAIFLLDGAVSRREGLACILAYVALLYLVQRSSLNSVPAVMEEVEEDLIQKQRATIPDIIKIVGGAVIIFFAGNVLVSESVFFSEALSIPSSIIGLLLLSIGTNVPELVIAVRAIQSKHKDIAFGDYLGSAVANTLVFGILPLITGNFSVERSEFLFSAVLMVLGLFLFYKFARSRNKISKKEGLVLLGVYAAFLIIQITILIRFAEQ